MADRLAGLSAYPGVGHPLAVPFAHLATAPACTGSLARAFCSGARPRCSARAAGGPSGRLARHTGGHSSPPVAINPDVLARGRGRPPLHDNRRRSLSDNDVLRLGLWLRHVNLLRVGSPNGKIAAQQNPGPQRRLPSTSVLAVTSRSVLLRRAIRLIRSAFVLRAIRCVSL